MINVIGLGYIGLPTALMFAASGNKIIGTDIDDKRVRGLQEGVIPFEEKGMTDLYDKAVKNDIQFSNEYHETDMYIITVPTPYDSYSKKNRSYLHTRSCKNCFRSSFR